MCFYTKVNNNVLLSNNDVILECQISPQRIVIRSSSKKIDNFGDQVRYEKRALEKRVRLPNVQQGVVNGRTYNGQMNQRLRGAEPVSLTFHSALRKLNTEPPIGASHQGLVIWLSSYREEDIQKSTNQKQEWPVAAMFINGSELNEQSLQMTFQGCFLPSFDPFGQAVSEETIFQKSTIQKQELPVAAMFVNGSGRNEQSLQRIFHRCFIPSFSSFG